jgi:GTPase SAR1 family protein
MVVIIYDLTDAESFKSVQKWADDIKEMRGDDGNTVLVGNKMDMIAKRAVSFDEGKAKSMEIKSLSFLETSAKTGENVKELFTLIGAKLTEKSNEVQQPSVKDLQKEGEEQKQTLKVEEGAAKEKKKCAC